MNDETVKADASMPAGEHAGVMVSNLGTPDAPATDAVRRYLAEFLSDPRVITTPRFLWLPILHGIILRTRPKKVAASYASIWTDDGSPLLTGSRRITAALGHVLAQRKADKTSVALGMRYGKPSIRTALDELREAGANRLIVLPLYPQFSYTTTASTQDAVAQALADMRWQPAVEFVRDYHDDAGYVRALAASIRAYQAAHGAAQRLLFSFHGLPQSYADAGDPYPRECEATARLLAMELGLDGGEWQMTYQSRFGPKAWLQPYTGEVLRELGTGGTGRVQVVCPGFPADCLETLEEIAMQYREEFLGAGGETYDYIPALNDDPAHVEALADIVGRHM